MILSTINEKIIPQKKLQNPFQSFWMAGYECTDQLNAFGSRVDLLATTRHLDLIGKDYQALSLLGIRTVREGIRWSTVEKAPYVYDWEPVGALVSGPTGLEAFEEIRRRLMARGAADDFVTDFGPILSMFFRDPDGLEAEVCVANPDGQPDVFNGPGTRAARYQTKE